VFIAIYSPVHGFIHLSCVSKNGVGISLIIWLSVDQSYIYIFNTEKDVEQDCCKPMTRLNCKNRYIIIFQNDSDIFIIKKLKFKKKKKQINRKET
jgi:hypothetical protein